ncbi:MAG: type II toxin-antitoxin system VapC family toxin [Armatimonadetes bacterium]|nr:type II toxin-antitoxin system VapC family toxin [Armatimonadota bacterium]
MRALTLTALSLAGLPLLSACAAETVVTDGNGRISAMLSGGESLAVETNLRLPLQGWGRLPGLTDARDVKRTREAGRTTWTGRIELEPGRSYRYEETLTETTDGARLDIRVTADAEVQIEGVFLWIDVPVAVFAGGACDLGGAVTALPVDRPAARHFARAQTNAIRLTDSAARTRLSIALDRALPVVVQDNREWDNPTYSAFCQLAPSLKAGESTALAATFALATQPDTSPARLTLDAGKVRYRLHGFGGNYCFGIESPITQYTLANLQQAWARTEMTPYEWEPENDNDDPASTNWDYLKAQDQPNSNLRREFELAKQIQDLGLPYVISIWGMPKWIYDPPATEVRGGRRKIAADQWDEACECLGSYLVYARDQYGVEPDLFCFNEANIGVDVWLTPEEHRDAIKLLGAHCAKLGLKTKMLLADATGPRGTHTYAEAAAADPEAMQYVTAVAFHSWGGASPQEYAAWGDLAERLKLPLLVTELGVDAGAWRSAAYDSFHYALREVQMYQELLLHARPQGTMQWEFTNDYAICKLQRDAAGNETVVPTVRYQFVRHFCNLTPLDADALTTASDRDKVLFTAFAGDRDGKRVHTLHLANLGAERPVTLEGLPSEVRQLRAVLTDETRSFEERQPVTPSAGTLELTLPALSLTTLTTLP